jgi:hypothetical protein
MIRALALAAVLLLTQGSDAGPASPLPRFPASLQATGDSARSAWARRDLAGFLAPAGGGRLLVSLPGGQRSAPITTGQAQALLTTYVQGTVEIATLLEGARPVDSTRGYVQLRRRYRLRGLPGNRESLILLGYRRGREGWMLAEVKIAS